MKNRFIISCVLLLLIIPLIFHLSYSWMGFNPTDDGTVLAGSRRILDGQVPHRDFISIRPVGSYLLHLIFIVFGGDYTLWISRMFVWFQFAFIIWAWIIITAKSLKHNFWHTWRETLFLIIIGLIGISFSAHNFPIMAWHTIDGIFISLLGLLLVVNNHFGLKALGYVFLGSAPIFRQNFIIFPLLVLGLRRDWKKISLCLATLIPLIIMLLYLIINGAFSDLLIQITSRTEIIQVGISKYFKQINLFFIAGGYIFSYLLNRHGRNFKFLGLFLLTVFISYMGIGLGTGKPFATTYSFQLLFFCIGLLVYYIIFEIKNKHIISLIIFALLLTWSSSISIGYNYPALASGLLIVLLLILTKQLIANDKFLLKYYFIFLIIVSGVTLINFDKTRNVFIYRDLESKNLNYNLGEVLEGGNFIKTNKNTSHFLKDLQEITHKYRDKQFAVIPDLAAYWIKSQSINPLPIDWVQGSELSKVETKQRVITNLLLLRNNGVVIVQKYKASSISNEFIPIDNTPYYTVVEYVRTNFTKIDETAFFEIYH